MCERKRDFVRKSLTISVRKYVNVCVQNLDQTLSLCCVCLFTKFFAHYSARNQEIAFASVLETLNKHTHTK